MVINNITDNYKHSGGKIASRKSLVFTQEIEFIQILTRHKSPFIPLRLLYLFRDLLFPFFLSLFVRMASEAPIKSQKSTRAYYWQF